MVGGAAATGGAEAAIALAVVGTCGALLALRPLFVLVIMGATAYIEAVQLGGTTISRFVAAAAVFVVLAELARTRTLTAPSGAPLVWAVCYSLWAFASVLWTVDLHETWLGLAPLAVSVAFMVAIPLLVRTRRAFDLVLYGIGVAAAIVGLVAVLVFVSTGGGRAGGFVGDPNFFAAYQVVAFPILLVLGARAKEWWLRMLLWGGVMAVVGATFSTLSRGGILSLAFVAILLLVLPARSIFRSFGHKSLATLVIAVGVALALAVSYTEVTRAGRLARPGRGGHGLRARERVARRLAALQGEPGDGNRHQRVPYGLQRRRAHDPGHRPAELRGAATGGVRPQRLPRQPHRARASRLPVLRRAAVCDGAALRRAAVRARWLGDLELARTANALLLSLGGWAIASFFLSSETARPLWILVGLALALPRVIAEAERARQPAQ